MMRIQLSHGVFDDLSLLQLVVLGGVETAKPSMITGVDTRFKLGPSATFGVLGATEGGEE